MVFRPTVRRLLASAPDPFSSGGKGLGPGGITGNPLRPFPANLLPPIPLYRRILRAHRKLPPEERTMGDMYVKAEFRAHQNVDNPVHMIGFLSQWQLYAQQIEGDNWRDGKLDTMQLERMNDQQVAQLYELMRAIKNRNDEEEMRPPEPPKSTEK